MSNTAKPPPSRPDARALRTARLEQALRSNLKRRKDQLRVRSGTRSQLDEAPAETALRPVQGGNDSDTAG